MLEVVEDAAGIGQVPDPGSVFTWASNAERFRVCADDLVEEFACFIDVGVCSFDCEAFRFRREEVVPGEADDFEDVFRVAACVAVDEGGAFGVGRDGEGVDFIVMYRAFSGEPCACFLDVLEMSEDCHDPTHDHEPPCF